MSEDQVKNAGVPPNKRRGEVAVPEAGDGAFLRFNMDVMERMHGALGEKYIDEIIHGLSHLTPETYKLCVGCMLVGGDPAGMPWDLSWEELQLKILDAMYLAMHKKTFNEHQKEMEERSEKEFEEALKNPQKAALLLSRMSSMQGTPRDSSQTKSEE